MTNRLKRSLTVVAIALMTLGIGGIVSQNASTNSNVHAQSIEEAMKKDMDGTLSPQEHANHEQDVKDYNNYEQALHRGEVHEATYDARYAATLRKTDPKLYKANAKQIKRSLHRISRMNRVLPTSKRTLKADKKQLHTLNRQLRHKHIKRTRRAKIIKQIKRIQRKINRLNKIIKNYSKLNKRYREYKY